LTFSSSGFLYNWGGFRPYPHQVEGVAEAIDLDAWAWLWDMRTGKTAVTIHNAAYLRQQGEIDGLLVMCPNYLKAEWEEQFHEHAPDWLQYEIALWRSGVASRRAVARLHPDNGTFNVLVINEEALSTKAGLEAVVKFLTDHEAMWAIDEATSISNPKAKRTKAVLKYRHAAKYRRILTGTPITKGPLDLWAPFFFLDPDILGYKTWYGMRNRYAIMGGYMGKETVGYRDTDVLKKLVAGHSSRVLRSDVRDMPEKIFTTVTVDMNPKQRAIYDDLKRTMVAYWDDKVVEVNTVLVQMLRLQQITGGFVPADADWMGEQVDAPVAGPIPGPNPKLDALAGIVAQTDEQVVIFARFKAEIRAIVERLGPDMCSQYHGGIKEQHRAEQKRRFMVGQTRFFVANQQSARMGLDLSQANLVIYYSNSFALLDRLQSQDRTETIHRDKGSTTYIDLVAANSLDSGVADNLRAKKSISDLITGDPLEEWL
jgi:SNF2 family DNA or RNA helicase